MTASHTDGGRASTIALGVLVTAVGLAGVLRGAGSIAAALAHVGQPTGDLAAGVDVLMHPTTPGIALGSPEMPTIVYWLIASSLTGAILVAIVGAVIVVRRGSIGRPGPGPVVEGLATRAEVRQSASAAALLRRAAHIRPSLARPGPEQIGYRIGSAHGVDVWASVEDSILVLGPPRSGKGLHLVVNTILDAPGAVVATSTRPDNLAITRAARADRGTVAVFDPQQLTGSATGLRWSPIRGCDDPLTAMIRAAGLASATNLSGGGVQSGGFWEGKTRTALQALLHAAALDRRRPIDLYRWTLDPMAAKDAAAILDTHPDAAPGWAAALNSTLDADGRSRDSVWQGVSLALAPLADPRVLDTVSPGDDDQFDPATFLTGNGTLYLLATGTGAGNAAPIVAAFIEDLVETARRMAARSPSARLDPPLLLALDEIGNLATLPSLPTLMAEGGGTGITTMPVLQSLAQARAKWGEHAAAAIWDAAIVKIILGGTANSRDLTDLATLIGDRDDTTRSDSLDENGSRASQRSIRRVPILPPAAIRTLPFGTALTLLRSAPPIYTRLSPWTRRSLGPESHTLPSRDPRPPAPGPGPGPSGIEDPTYGSARTD